MLRTINFTALILIFSSTGWSQFGFERNSDIDVFRTGEEQIFPWVGGMDYCQFSNIDLNFDGTEDLFVFDRTCNKVLTFIQNGGVGEIDYAYAPEYEELFPEGLENWVLLVDYNCDGKKDIYASTIGGAKVYKNIGNETDGNVFELAKPLLRTSIFDSETYMYVSAADIPSVVDIDGDGDMDVLSFGVLGLALEYHKNLSMDLYGVCDSLVYETKNICWGRFREDNATNEVTLWDTLEYPCRGSDFDAPEYPVISSGHQDRHAGSAVLALDMNENGVMDLILGDVSYPNMVMLMNSGTEVNTNSGMESQDIEFPSTSTPVDLAIFPAAYHVDFNNDDKRDLVVSPNSKIGSQNAQSVWNYVNEGTDLAPDFVYQSENFLQKDMIDVGTSSYPVFFDHNGDGLKDLLVSAQGQYNPVSGNQICKISYYENTGTAEVPVFEFVTDDYAGLSTMDIGATLAMYPTFGDLDGDGDEDMILGEYTGYCYYLENTGGAGSPAIFSTFSTLLNSEGSPIFEGTYVYPNLIDLDRDGDEDLVIGRRTGKLQYFENTGVGTYNFEFRTSNLGGVDVSGAEFIEGHAITQFVDIDEEYHLLVGSRRGYLYYYDDVEDNLDGTFHLVDSIVDGINIGTYTAPAVTNLNGDNRFEMALGNRRGGLVLFQSAPTTNIGLNDLSGRNEITIYPNPATNAVRVDFGSLTAHQLKSTEIIIYNLTGQLMERIEPQQNSVLINTEKYAKGTYLINVIDGEQSVKKKLIIQ